MLEPFTNGSFVQLSRRHGLTARQLQVPAILSGALQLAP